MRELGICSSGKAVKCSLWFSARTIFSQPDFNFSPKIPKFLNNVSSMPLSFSYLECNIQFFEIAK